MDSMAAAPASSPDTQQAHHEASVFQLSIYLQTLITNAKPHRWRPCLMHSHVRRFAGEIVIEVGNTHAGVVTGTVRSKGKLINAIFRIVDRLTPDAVRFTSFICLNPSIEKVVIEIVGSLRLWLFFV